MGGIDKRSAVKWRLAMFAVAALLLLGNFRLILGQAAPHLDAADFFGPAFSLVADHVKHGRLLMWDPWVAGGSPDLAEPELGTTSPLMLLIGLLSPNPQAGFAAYWLTLWAIGALGMLFLARHLGSPLWGALVVTLGYTASGFYTGHAEHTSSICSIAYLPWILWRFDLAILNKNYWFAIQAGILFGLSTLGGYPQLTILTPGFLVMWAAGRVFFGDEPAIDKRQRWMALLRASAFLGIIVAVGLVICSPAYTAIFKDTPGYSDRVGPRARDEAISSNLLPAGALTTFASPFIALLNVSPHRIWANTDISMTSVYMGAGAFLLACLGWQWRIAWRNWLLVMAIFFTCCAMGSQLPLRGWLYDFVPPTRYFRNPALFREYVILTLSILGALAAHDLSIARSTLRRRFLPVAGLLAAVAGIAFYAMVRLRPETKGHLLWPLSHLAFVWIGVLVAGYFFGRGQDAFKAAVRVMMVLAVIDFLGTLAVSRPSMYTEATLNWWHAMNTEHIRNLDLTPQGLARSKNAPPEVADFYPNNRNVPLRVATLDSYVTLANRFHQQLVNGPAVRSMALGKDRIWFSANPIWVKPTDAEFALFVQTFRSSGAPILLLHSLEQMNHFAQRQTGISSPQIAIQPVCDRAEVTNLSYRPDSISFHYQAAAAGWIMITDRWAPGWHATVNGREAPVLGADFLFRAVPVAPGGNDIRLQYQPSGFLPLLGVSWGTLLAFAAAEIRRRVRRVSMSIIESEPEQENSTYLYLVSNGKKGKPSPLFDRAYYLRNNAAVAAQNEDPLAHYMRAGALELRNPHALFDAQYYVEQHPDVLAEKANPLLHFVAKGADRGYNPNRLFDINYYLWRNPDVKSSGMNPLVHFILHGAQQNLDPHPLFGMKDYAERYPDVIQAGTDPLSHYLKFGQYEKRIASRALYFHEALEITDSENHRVCDGQRNPRLDAPLPVFCVYGPSHIGFLRNAVLPAFANQKTRFPIELNFLNYKSPQALLDSQELCDGSITAILRLVGIAAIRPSGVR